jgi:hypothetical protein
MKKQIETHFPIVVTNGCLQTVSEIEFGISEPEKDKGGRSIVVAKEGADFEVENPNQKDIVFWAIDECTLFSKDKDKRCDFAIFDDETFAFAEIKRSPAKNRQQSRTDAVIQLTSILDLCKGKLDFSQHKLLVIIALTFSKTYPIARTRKQDAELSFFNNYRAQLLEGNSISFPFDVK